MKEIIAAIEQLHSAAASCTSTLHRQLLRLEERPSLEAAVALQARLLQLGDTFSQLMDLVVKTNDFVDCHLDRTETFIANIRSLLERGGDINGVDRLLLGSESMSEESWVDDYGGSWEEEQARDELLASTPLEVSAFSVTIPEMLARPREYQQLAEYEGVSIGECAFPVARRLEDIPEAIYYFAGDGKHSCGLYVRLAENCIVQVPLPDVSSAATVSRSIPCHSSSCSPNPRKNCPLAHRGETIMKMGSLQRCTRKAFGKHVSLEADIMEVTRAEIRQLLMNAMSDSLLCAIWGKRKLLQRQVIGGLGKMQ